MINSELTHVVKFGTPANRNSAQSTPSIPGYARNGEGSPTTVIIDKAYADPNYVDAKGRDLATMIAHEVYGHSYDSDRGNLRDMVTNQTSGLKESEHSAMKAENIFNRDAGRKAEKCYGSDPLDGKSKC
jgi:hypothetical protein